MTSNVLKKAIMPVVLGATLFWGLAALTAPQAAEQAGGKIQIPKPGNHVAAWPETHGKSVEPGADGERNCYGCHEKNDCIVCHNTKPPRDHTNTWRTLSHGFAAEGNRDRCQICHKQDYCIRCHRETAPRTHRGGWNTISAAGAPDRPTHCVWCHFSSGLTPADNCVVCHKKAPHTSAPHAVNGSVDCTQCHR